MNARQDRKEAIHAEVMRRIDAGLPLNYRDIRRISGGSNSTIKAIIEAVRQGNTQSVLPQEPPVPLPAPTATPDPNGILASLIPQVIELVGRMTYLADRTDHAYRRLMVEVDGLRTLKAPRPEGADTGPATPEPSPPLSLPATQGPSAEVSALKRQVQGLTANCTRLSERVEYLKRRLEEANVPFE